MPDTISAFVTSSLNGRTFSTDLTVSGENIGGSTPSVTPAKAGALTTRTDNDTGTVTMADSGHGIVTADKVDVYWAGGMRRNMTVGTVSGTSVPIDAGSGDNLPIATTAVTLKVPQTEGAHAVAGANVVGIVAKATSYRGQIVIRQSDGTEILHIPLPAGGSYTWSLTSGLANPVTGVTIGKATFSHENTTDSQEMPFYFLYN